MGHFTIEFADETACPYCSTIVPLTQEQEECGHCGAMLFRLTAPDFFSEVQRRRVLDVRHGGLIMGKSGKEDDIPLLQSEGNGIYSLKGFMHGGEYILSSAATHRHFKRLEEINSEMGMDGYGNLDVRVSRHTCVINVDLVSDFLGLWIDPNGQFIINAFATAKHFLELEKLNSEAA